MTVLATLGSTTCLAERPNKPLRAIFANDFESPARRPGFFLFSPD